jgi:very-short-patch-repair endonuclease
MVSYMVLLKWKETQTTMHNKKLSAKARKAIRERMTPAQKAVEDTAKLVFLNDFRLRHGLSILTSEEAGMVA